MRDSEAAARVGAAVRGGHVTPAMRPRATAPCLQDVGSFDSFVAKSPAPFAHLWRPAISGQVPDRQDLPAFNPAGEAAVCARPGLKPGSLKP